MSSSQVQCDGCQHSFSTSGLASHLRQTQNPGCKEIHDNRFGYAPHTNSRSPSGDANDSEPEDFLGDFFGDGEEYGPDDFLGWSDDERELNKGSDSHSFDSDEDSDESDQDLHYGWEPEPEVGQEAQPPPEEDLDADAAGDVHNQLPLPATRQHAESQLRIVPQYVERFNDSKGRTAGRPVRTQTASGSAHTIYKEKVPGGASNIWAPFNSKMEWEISRWAKLRGAGSTAFSELLAIEGVRN